MIGLEQSLKFQVVFVVEGDGSDILEFQPRFLENISDRMARKS